MPLKNQDSLAYGNALLTCYCFDSVYTDNNGPNYCHNFIAH